MASEPTAPSAAAPAGAGDQTLQALVREAVEVIPGAESAGITHARRIEREVDVRYASDSFIAELDKVQHAVGQGPCLDALQQRQPIRVDDFALEDRWPRFCERARELGAGSLLSLPLSDAAGSLAALNLYSRRPHAFDEESEQTGLLFAAHSAIALGAARHVQELHRALFNRDIIGQAKGILMERFKIASDQAFQVLVTVSNETNTKLREVAERVVLTGDVPSR